MFSETPAEVEYRIRVPAGTKRTELNIALEDAAGTNLWRNEWSDYAAGGEARAVVGATLRVQPTCWAAPLLAGTLRGSVDPRECSFEVEAAEGGESCLHLSLAKADGSAWGGLLIDALDVVTEDTTRQELVERMALHLGSLPVQLECAWRCCEGTRTP